MPILVTPEVAAHELGISRATIYPMIMSGDLPSLRIGARRLIPLDALHAWVSKQLAEQAPAGCGGAA